MKKIIVKWYKLDNDGIYDSEMRVVYSDNPMFETGSRFDYGFMSIASRAGYIIEVLP